MTMTETPSHGDPLALDLRVITDAPADLALIACANGTDDGRDPTSASVCVTGGV